MAMHSKLYTVLGLLLAALVALVLYFYPRTAATPAAPDAFFSCANGTMAATFDTDTVTLVLSDGRTLTLPQTPSGSGIRYGAEGVEFMSKGSWAVLSENGTNTYDQCVVNAEFNGKPDEHGWKPFTDMGNTVSFRYPEWATPTNPGEGYTQEWAAGSEDLGSIMVRITIPDTFEPQTNFRDARFSIGTSADPAVVASCTTPPAWATEHSSEAVLNDVPFTLFTFGDAGAGNFYETTAYRTVHGDQCYSVEYTVHTTNVANYPEELGIREYDRQKVVDVLEGMVHSVRFVE